jgi:hypothetical protein
MFFDRIFIIKRVKYLFSYFHIFLQREEQALINANNMKPVVKVSFFSFYPKSNIVMTRIADRTCMDPFSLELLNSAPDPFLECGSGSRLCNSLLF